MLRLVPYLPKWLRVRLLARRVRAPNAEELAWAERWIDRRPLTTEDIARTHELDKKFGWSKHFE